MGFICLLLLFVFYYICDNNCKSVAESPGNYTIGPPTRHECALREKLVFDKLLKNYVKHKVPDPGTVKVMVEMHIQDVSNIDQMSSEMDADIMFSEVWHDPDLSFVDMHMCRKWVMIDYQFLRDKIWTPNTCIVNSKETRIHTSPSDNIFVQVFENGSIWTNYRMRLKAPCELNFVNFPLDYQSCALEIESYSYSADQVQLRWMPQHPITLMKRIRLPDFTLDHHTILYSQQEYPNGHWDRLTLTFVFARNFGYYFMQAYVPTYLTIMISWVSFQLHYTSVPARATLGVSSLMAMTFQFGNIIKNLPRVSYVKALDVFILGSTLFIFAVLIELAVVSYAARMLNKDRDKLRQNLMRRHAVTSACDGSHENNYRKSSFAYHKDENATAELQQRHMSSPGQNSPLLGNADKRREKNKFEKLRRFRQSFSLDSHHYSASNGYTSVNMSKHSQENLEDCQLYMPGKMLEVLFARPHTHRLLHPEQIDKIASYLFPAVFLAFNLFYWFFYLVWQKRTL